MKCKELLNVTLLNVIGGIATYPVLKFDKTVLLTIIVVLLILQFLKSKGL
ncbi:hypothetical protein SDC9_187685 [bioreactor metagenome]|uniref:Uncharacterized protein n=1 Tax=bioreactor metagenome TaxID=1076179 RepID=A0A645HPI1_9ZZZZ